jgi:hypothetical protein
MLSFLFWYLRRRHMACTVPRWACVASKSSSLHSPNSTTYAQNSALFTLYDSSILHQQNDIEKSRILGMLEEASTAIVSFSAYLFGEPEKLNYATFSPFVPYSLYQAGIVQFRLWKQTSALRHRESLDSVKKILGFFNMRWLIGGMIPETVSYLGRVY